MKHIIKKAFLFLALFTVSLFAISCHPTKTLARSNPAELRAEGDVIIARPSQYTIVFGSRSISEYLDIAYNRTSYNSAGFLMNETGIRNRGGTRWYNFAKASPRYITVYVRADFYATALPDKSAGPPVYSTNRRQIKIRLGDIYNFRAVCPVKTANSCQIFISE